MIAFSTVPGFNCQLKKLIDMSKSTENRFFPNRTQKKPTGQPNQPEMVDLNGTQPWWPIRPAVKSLLPWWPCSYGLPVMVIHCMEPLFLTNEMQFLTLFCRVQGTPRFKLAVTTSWRIILSSPLKFYRFTCTVLLLFEFPHNISQEASLTYPVRQDRRKNVNPVVQTWDSKIQFSVSTMAATLLAE